MTAGGTSLTGGTRAYMDRLRAQAWSRDPAGRRHHFVPQSYLRQWSSDGKRVWALDTVTGAVRLLGTRSVCVEEDFYRVVGPGGVAHNRVEAMFGVVDSELRRVQLLFDRLQDPEELGFDDLLGLGVSVAVQRMRTSQSRRLRLQQDAARVPTSRTSCCRELRSWAVTVAVSKPVTGHRPRGLPCLRGRSWTSSPPTARSAPTEALPRRAASPTRPLSGSSRLRRSLRCGSRAAGTTRASAPW